MEIKVSCFEVQINEDDELDFNWANIHISVPATGGPTGAGKGQPSMVEDQMAPIPS